MALCLGFSGSQGQGKRHAFHLGTCRLNTNAGAGALSRVTHWWVGPGVGAAGEGARPSRGSEQTASPRHSTQLP